MPQCMPLMIWRPIPDKSTLEVRVTGDENVFDVQMDVECASQPSATLPHEDLVPGPAKVKILLGDHCTFDLLLNINQTPPENQPVIVDMRIVDEKGDVVTVSDGHGGTRQAQCRSQFTDATDSTPVGIVVVAVADKPATDTASANGEETANDDGTASAEGAAAGEGAANDEE